MRHNRELTPDEADELEALCIASDTRPLSLAESTRVYELQGFPPEEAAWYAAAGGMWINRATRVDEE